MTASIINSDRRRLVITGVAAAVLLVIAGFLILRARTGSDTSAADAALQRGAQAALPTLRLSGKGYDAEPTFFRMYQRYVYETRARLVSQTAKALPKGQWAQVLVIEARSMPVQSVVLNPPSHKQVPLDAAVVQNVLQTHKPAYATARTGKDQVRAYVTPLQPPSVFDGQNVTALLEVMQKTGSASS